MRADGVAKRRNPRHKIAWCGGTTKMMDDQHQGAGRAMRRVILSIALLLAGPCAWAASAPAPKAPIPESAKAPVAVSEPADSKEEGTGKASSLPVPRFVSLRTEPINLRTGPGVRYPVEWVYVRKRLPVEVIGEFDTWRRIRDPDGTEGWVHQTMLSGRRTATITQDNTALRREGNDGGAAIARLESHVIVNVQRCPAETAYCRVEVNGMQGWVKRDALWGVYPTETVQ
jgi:SH3-like domain-containing protein